MLVKEVMSTQIVQVSPEDSVQVAARLLSRRNVGSLPVTDASGRLLGIVTDRDVVLRCVAAACDPAETRVGQIMSAHPLTVRPDDEAQEAAALMAQRQIRRLPVTEGGRVVGLLSLGDLAARRDSGTEAAEALCDICSNLRRA